MVVIKMVAYIENLVEIVQWFLRKASFNFKELGTWARNDLDLEYSHILINSISCLHLHRLQ